MANFYKLSTVQEEYRRKLTTADEAVKVIKSGDRGIYPKGIKIGTIKEVIETKNVTQRYAILETATDFNNLEYVLVIKK